MDLDEARAYLREHHRGVLSTFRSDGRPQMSPIAVGVDDEGRALISSREPVIKTKNLRRDQRASVLAFDDNWKTFVHFPKIDDVACWRLVRS